MWFFCFRQIKLYEDKATKSKEEFGRLVGRLSVSFLLTGIRRCVGSRSLRTSSPFEGLARSHARAACTRGGERQESFQRSRVRSLAVCFARHNWKVWSQVRVVVTFFSRK